MKALIISDLHGNYDALSALPEGYDELWVLGDLVNYGPQPAAIVEFVQSKASPNWRYLIPIGFIGGYTTFSTFEYETLRAIQDGQFTIGTLNVVLSVLVGFLMVWTGSLVGKALV